MDRELREERVMGKWTPGPWKAIPEMDISGYRINGGEQEQLAFVFAQDKESYGGAVAYCGSAHPDADARLIAKAPDMAERLAHLLPALRLAASGQGAAIDWELAVDYTATLLAKIEGA